MKISILYFSQTGNTQRMADIVKTGMETVPNVEVRMFPLDAVDDDFLNESKAVIFGTPTYFANTCWQLKKWFDESHNYNLGGKLGAVFATANGLQGGFHTALSTVIDHLITKGMLVYSSGTGCGRPYIHLGAVAVKGHYEQGESLCYIFGQRIAQKASELFGE
ncbi:flavodoxin family protein [Desulfofarcimen acetoxidans]|nr:flavodoxin domain-containing protein [Desulfofarcimen acetoxidans]